MAVGEVSAAFRYGKPPDSTGWTTEAAPLFLVTPGRRQLTPLLRALRDFIAERTAALEREAE